MRSPTGFLAHHPSTHLHAGPWQTVLPTLTSQNLTYHAIYFDTFAEPYASFRDFFTEHLISLLAPSGRWSFFHGLGADRRVCYDVYTKVAEMDLFEAGYDVRWVDVAVDERLRGAGTWEGVRRRYWDLETYRLPVCGFLGDEDLE